MGQHWSGFSRYRQFQRVARTRLCGPGYGLSSAPSRGSRTRDGAELATSKAPLWRPHPRGAPRVARLRCTEKTDGSHSEPQDHEMVKRWHHDSIIAAAGKLE